MRYNIEIKTGNKEYDEYLESLGYKQMLNILISRVDRDEKRMLKINTKSKIVITGAEPSKYVYFFIDERPCCVKYWIFSQTKSKWEGVCSYFWAEKLEGEDHLDDILFFDDRPNETNLYIFNGNFTVNYLK